MGTRSCTPAKHPMIRYLWKADYGDSNWDIRHRFTASFVYDIPFFTVSDPLLKEPSTSRHDWPRRRTRDHDLAAA
jgi:hypothetical protein